MVAAVAEPELLSELAYRSIRDLIVTLDLPPGAVVSEADLMARLRRQEPYGETPLIDSIITAARNDFPERADGPKTLVVLTETDVLGNEGSAQDDGDRYRRWEIAGTAHLDNYDMAVLTGHDPTRPAPAGAACQQPMNDAHQWWVMNAGFHHLEAWVGGGPPPPSARPSRPGSRAARQDQPDH